MTAAAPVPESTLSPAEEAGRLMTICNACRYCEGVCAVFPAMELRREFAAGDLDYLAHLCHSCGACYVDCQFAPPHEFAVNVPLAMAKLRADTYARHAWPRVAAPFFARNGLWVALAAAASVAIFVAGFVFWHDPAVLFGVHSGPGAFYRLMPHDAMVLVFGGAFSYACVAIVLGLASYWRAIGPAGAETPDTQAAFGAMRDAGTLRYLDGGGAGCHEGETQPIDRRRLHHHLTFYGFLACFASTSVATLYHYAFEWQAPYPFLSVPVVLGTLGGIAIAIGTVGLLRAKLVRDPDLVDGARLGMDTAFLAMLFLTATTGLALLALRETAAMGLLLAIHLGVVFAFFLTMPYGRFMHGPYRLLALAKYAVERRRL
jgi:citrate/tricarballylate utilization protein